MHTADNTTIFLKLERRSSTTLMLALFAIPIFMGVSFAQETELDDVAPPPLKIVSRAETAQLNAESDVKRRTELALKLMDVRLRKAETLKESETFDTMLVELGVFHGLIENTSRFLHTEHLRRGKAFSYFKKYEMGLRAFTPRLELVRRDLPDRYGYYLKTLLRTVRDARSKALEPFFGDTVLPNQ